jgi:hypothetical protein
MDSAIGLLALVAYRAAGQDGDWIWWLIVGIVLLLGVVVLLLPRGVLNQLWLHGRWSKPPEGCCQNCGYDLRATPRRCPECGTVPVRKPRKYVQYRGIAVRCRRPAEADD